MDTFFFFFFTYTLPLNLKILDLSPNYRKKLSHVTMDITSEHIQKLFRINEISRTCKVQSQLMAKVMHE